MTILYKIIPQALWQKAQQQGFFDGAPVDHQDGFIHFSLHDQLLETANKHFKGQKNLLLISVEQQRLGDGLKYEISRGGALFPHFYGILQLDDIAAITPFNADETGIFTRFEP